MIDTIILILLVIFIGIWRRWDGSAPKPEGFWPSCLVYVKDGKAEWKGYTTFRNIVGLLLGAGAGWFAFGEWGALIVALAIANLIFGYTKWESWRHQLFRFGVPAAAIIGLAIYLGIGGEYIAIWPGIMAVSATSYSWLAGLSHTTEKAEWLMGLAAGSIILF